MFSRLATVRRLAASATALFLAAVVFASCGGGSDAKLLPGATAREITENLARVKQYVAEGECVGAADAATEVDSQVEALQNIDAKLKQALQQGAEKLGKAVASCEEATIETTTTEETTKPEGPEPPGQEKKEEKEREKEEKTLEKEEQAEEHEAPPPKGPPAETPPASPDEGGGPGHSGGVGPGEAVGQGED